MRSFGTCCHTLHGWRCHHRARLASGWPAEPLPGGSRTLWIAARGFSSCRRSSSSPALLTQQRFAARWAGFPALKAHRVALFFVPSRTRGWCAGRRWCGTPHHLRAAFRGTPRDTFKRRLAPSNVGRAPPGAPTAAFARGSGRPTSPRVPPRAAQHGAPLPRSCLVLRVVLPAGNRSPDLARGRGYKPRPQDRRPQPRHSECPREDARRGARVSKP